MTDKDNDGSSAGHGGARPGAGAPKRNIRLPDVETARMLRELARGSEEEFVAGLIRVEYARQGGNMKGANVLTAGWNDDQMRGFIRRAPVDAALYEHQRTGNIAFHDAVAADDKSFEEGCEPEGYQEGNIWRYRGTVGDERARLGI